MRITQNTVINSFLSGVQDLTAEQAKLYSQLTTGQKITTSSDDPSGASEVMALQSDQRNLEQYKANIQTASAISEVTYSKVSALSDLVIQAEEIATSADDLTESSEYTSYAIEVESLIESAIDLLNSKYNGNYIFGGTDIESAPVEIDGYDADGNITGVTYVGNDDAITVKISDGIAVSPYSTPEDTKKLVATINNLIQLREALSQKDPAAVATVNETLQSDGDEVIDQMSKSASVQARLEIVEDQISASSTAITNRVSSVADVDITSATVEYYELYTSFQAAMSAGSKMLSISLLDYI